MGGSEILRMGISRALLGLELDGELWLLLLSSLTMSMTTPSRVLGALLGPCENLLLALEEAAALACCWAR